MEYIKILDDSKSTTIKKNGYNQFYSVIKNELYTLKEFKQLNFVHANNLKTKKINISKNKTFFFFGARFERLEG